MDSGFDERRRHPRAEIDIPIELQIGGRPVSGRLLDISAAGAGLHVEAPLEEHSLLGVDFEVEGHEGRESIHVRAHAAVVRCEAADEGGWRAGLYFVQIRDEDRDALDRYVDELLGDVALRTLLSRAP